MSLDNISLDKMAFDTIGIGIMSLGADQIKLCEIKWQRKYKDKTYFD